VKNAHFLNQIVTEKVTKTLLPYSRTWEYTVKRFTDLKGLYNVTWIPTTISVVCPGSGHLALPTVHALDTACARYAERGTYQALAHSAQTALKDH
jgi:hypothetical protein